VAPRARRPGVRVPDHEGRARAHRNAEDVRPPAVHTRRTAAGRGRTAREEAAFFASEPGQAITYQVGKLQVLRFLSDARLALGEQFSLRAFHDALWTNGNVPIALQQWEYLGAEDAWKK